MTNWVDTTTVAGDWTIEADGHDRAVVKSARGSQWQRTPGFTGHQGPCTYRTSLATSVDDPRQRRWLVLDGVFYTSDVWWDATLLGDTEGYFVAHQFEITELATGTGPHELSLDIACTPPTNKRRKRAITGVFHHWEQFNPEWNPGGLWRMPRIEKSGPVRIRHSRVLCTDAHTDLATVSARLVLDSAEELEVEIVTRVSGVEKREVHRLATGENQMNWTLGVEDPELWWPHSMGAQPLHEVQIDVLVQDDLSDRITRRIGFRSVDTTNWITRINGERLFVKGANQGPTKYWLSEATTEDHRDVVAAALDTGLDMLRLQSHVTDPAFYDAADNAGLLVWQDFPLQWGYHVGIRRQATRQAREMVDLLGHHPSIALWCAHHEPIAIEPSAATWADAGARRRLIARTAAAQGLPAYNRTVIDSSVTRTIRKCDPSRPVISHAGGLPRLPQLSGTDTHLFLGWLHGDERALPGLAVMIPRLVRFLGAFGAQSPPDSFADEHGDAWPDPDWQRLGREEGLNRAAFDRVVPPEAFDTAAEWVDAAQRYQADVIRYHVETLRRLKYRPSGGFATQGFVDAAPGTSFNVIDASGHSKAAHRALRDACRPVLPIADRLPPHAHAGERLDLELHIVNDLRIDLDDIVTEAVVQWPTGSWTRRWLGSVPADSCVRIGEIDPNLDVAIASRRAPDGPVCEGGQLDVTVTVFLPDGPVRSSASTPFVDDHVAHHHG